ncbi:MAG: hypothetical protein GXX85_17260, partial [Ignavibacteria bacterium]|nr:hypothetical protein [Ignavibacteria bacterium]
MYEYDYIPQSNITKIFGNRKGKREQNVKNARTGGWGKRFYRFIFFFSYFGPAVRSLKKFQGEAQAGGQKGRGSGGRNFCPPALPAEGGLGVG